MHFLTFHNSNQPLKISKKTNVKSTLGNLIPKCDKCGKVFKYQNQLEAHVAVVHNKERNHKCDHCGKIFGFVAVLGDISLLLGAVIFNSMFTPLLNQTGIPGMAYITGGTKLYYP